MEIRLDQSQISLYYDRSAIRHRTLEAPKDCQRMSIGEGTFVAATEDGQLVYAEYASGVRVRRHKESVFVRSSDGTYWSGDCKGRWYRLD